MTTVLLVDDSRVSREVIKVFLIGRHLRILEAADGLEALRILGEHHVDLVISDLEMPELDGVGLCERMHADPRLRRIGVLVLSGTATPQLARRCRAVGVLEILAKPIQPRPFIEAVDRHLPSSPTLTPVGTAAEPTQRV